jgi:hypothetical protein
MKPINNVNLFSYVHIMAPPVISYTSADSLL